MPRWISDPYGQCNNGRTCVLCALLLTNNIMDKRRLELLIEFAKERNLQSVEQAINAWVDETILTAIECGF